MFGYALDVGVTVGLVIFWGRYCVSDAFISWLPRLYWGRTLVFEGKVVDAGMEYVFLGYNASGESRELELTFK